MYSYLGLLVTAECCLRLLRAACRQTVSAGGPFWSFLPGGLLVWCPLAKSSLTLESSISLPKAVAGSCGRARNQKSCNFESRISSRWCEALGLVGVFYLSALILLHSLELWACNKHCALVLPSAEKKGKRKALFFWTILSLFWDPVTWFGECT